MQSFPAQEYVWNRIGHYRIRRTTCAYSEYDPGCAQKSGVDPADVIGIGIDFTACTMLPVKTDGTPLCALLEYRKIRMPG